MTQTMRERLQAKVADEVFEAVTGRLAEFEFVTDHEQERIDATARKVVNAILAELREPDEAMIYDGVAVNDVLDPHDAPPSRYEVERAFTAMIDAIRGEQG